MRRVNVLLATAIAAVACQPAQTTLTAEKKAEIVEQVNAANDAYWDASRSGDWDREKAFYLQTPEFVWVSGGRAFWGFQKLEDARLAVHNLASQIFRFRHEETLAVAPDVASVTAEGLWAQTNTDGVTSPERPFAWTAVWVRHDSEWRMHSVHMSFPVPER